MNKKDLIENLGTIARSGTNNFLNEIKKNKSKNNDLSAIGQFGVGFYSSFMVADKVEVSTKKAGENKSWSWISDGKNKYSIKKSNKTSKGTIIKLFMKKDSKEFFQ